MTDAPAAGSYEARHMLHSGHVTRVHTATLQLEVKEILNSIHFPGIEIPGTRGKYIIALVGDRKSGTDQVEFFRVSLARDPYRTRLRSRSEGACAHIYISVRNLDTQKIVAESKAFEEWIFDNIDYTPRYWKLKIPASDICCDGPKQLEYRMLVTLTIRDNMNSKLEFGDWAKSIATVVGRMADNFESPDNGDIEFICNNTRDGTIKRLYAMSEILSSRSRYYKTMFESSFLEGRDTNKRILTVDDDFDLFHNILYYIYTDHITFGTDLTFKPETGPNLCKPEDIYVIADRMLLDTLQEKALDFLVFCRTEEDITAHLFSPFALLYPQVSEGYETFFRKNWESVKTTKEFDQFFEELKEDEILRVYERFREIMKDSEFSHN